MTKPFNPIPTPGSEIELYAARARHAASERLDAVVAAVKAYALANYNRQGWDYIVECWSDADIREAVAGCDTAKAGIATVRKTAKLLNERRQEVRAESGEY